MSIEKGIDVADTGEPLIDQSLSARSKAHATLAFQVCGTFSHYCFANALRYADATIVVPMDFLRVPLTATAGWLIYSERLDLFTVLGAALILAGNLLNLRVEGEKPARAGT